MIVDIFNTLREYITFYPLLAFVCLLMAGLNLPMSEDLVIITGAILGHANPDIILPTLIAIYIGAIGTDFMVFGIGKKVRRGVSKSKSISKLLSQKRFDTISYYMKKFGVFTFIVCRFIPFGVRNALCMTAGLVDLRLRYFAPRDITAGMISINTLYFLVYFNGERIANHYKEIGVVLFILLVSAISFLIIRSIVHWLKSRSTQSADTTGC